MKPEYIFISGVSRTGSTLLVRILNQTNDIAITNRENWFLGHQIPSEGVRYAIKKNIGDLSDQENVYKLVKFLYEGNFKRSGNGYWRWLREYTDRDEFLQRLLSAPERDERTIFTIMMEIQGLWLQRKDGFPNKRPIFGEKTPPHIYYVPTLLEWYPNSKVIHTFRDPRGIFASELRRRNYYPISFPYKQLHKLSPVFYMYILGQVTYMWLRAAKLHFQYQKLYPDRYCLLKFEDLVTTSRQTLNQLCDFLEVEFKEEMLEQKVVSRGFKAGQKGFDKHTANRWREINPTWVNLWFGVIGKKYLKELGYAS